MNDATVSRFARDRGGSGAARPVAKGGCGGAQELGDGIRMLDDFRWQIPDAYWRARLPKDIIFEVEDLVSTDIDWQYL
ncbi:hypothetical protein VTN77DRAFT_3696 [Rasamsonia byssochlamydoides]|uniref:uncharacterized protein n=1 Tax=Rasamsonia byssochlamydoides TaxID=89139 RepID=UPI0037445622